MKVSEDKGLPQGLGARNGTQARPLHLPQLQCVFWKAVSHGSRLEKAPGWTERLGEGLSGSQGEHEDICVETRGSVVRVCEVRKTGRAQEPGLLMVAHGAGKLGSKAKGCWFPKPTAVDAWLHFPKFSFLSQRCFNISSFYKLRFGVNHLVPVTQFSHFLKRR